MISPALTKVLNNDESAILTLVYNNGAYYWVGYAGMGSSTYKPVNNNDAFKIQEYVDSGKLTITDELVMLPVYCKNSVLTFVGNVVKGL